MSRKNLYEVEVMSKSDVWSYGQVNYVDSPDPFNPKLEDTDCMRSSHAHDN